LIDYLDQELNMSEEKLNKIFRIFENYFWKNFSWLML